ncbi:MAG: SIMPL domain-containing protein [Pseudomonadota bacterium]|nr:SIMPL domain-containing protein [Pseudomonadota bacterium]
MNTLNRGLGSLALALALGTCMSLALAEESYPPTIAVGGHGEVSTAPDRAQLALAVDVVDQELAKARSSVDGVVRKYLESLNKLGIKAADISTTGVSLQPEYVWDEAGRKQTLVGYRARRDIRIVVRDLDQLGDLILRATDAGVNQINPPMLESSKAEALGREALATAAKDAQIKAETLAKALGVKLGSARIVRESGGNAPPMMVKAMAMRGGEAFDSGNQQMGLSTGEIRITSDVQVEFDLKASP